MSDDRNDGSVPPAPVPAAPPPLAETPPAAAAPPPAVPTPPPAAAAPPPVQPVPAPYYPGPPAPAPYYPAAPARRGAGLWPLFTFLAFAVGVGGTILTLWLSGELWNSQSSSYSGPGYSSGTGNSAGSNFAPAPAPVPAPTPAPTTSGGSMPTASTLAGTWGPNCPGSRDEAITFYSDGTASGDGESGTWSISGNYVSLNNGSRTMTVYWEMAGNDMARVRQSGESDSRTVYRCQ